MCIRDRCGGDGADELRVVRLGNAYIVVGEALHHLAVACLLPEDGTDGTSEGCAEGVVSLAGEGEEFLRAELLFGCGYSGFDL